MHCVTANFMKFGAVKTVLIHGGGEGGSVNGFVSKFRKLLSDFGEKNLV